MSDSCGSAGGALGSPIEKVNAPPTGWLSAEITRQLNKYVPRSGPAGGVTVTIAPAVNVIEVDGFAIRQEEA
jgi:hypothetical protein